MPVLYLVNLGCAKNQVDLECMLGRLIPGGCTVAGSPRDADVLLVNTCAFIKPATDESSAVIRELSAAKRPGQKLVVTGCLPQRHGAGLGAAFPAVDRWVPLADEARIAEVVAEWFPLAKGAGGARIRISPPHYAYLRIADGCDHRCAFCTIPGIRGAYRSVPFDAVVDEAKRLADEGVIELNLIAQDTGAYGRDLARAALLPRLVRTLAALDGIEWVRLQYLYPASVTDELLDTIAGNAHVCKYLDIPLQHVSDPVLKSMRRPGAAATRALLDRIRARVPGAAIRTTFIVGYPAEDARAFDELRDFAAAFKFDRLGVFEYSAEPGTRAHALGDPVAKAEKARRRRVILEQQQRLSLELNKRFVGRTVMTIVDVAGKNGAATGRTQFDAPEADNCVRMSRCRDVKAGSIVPVTITRALPYDLVGAVAPGKKKR